MKNIKIKLKILLSFGIVIALTLVFAALVVISSIMTLNNVRGMRAEVNMQTLCSNIMEYFSLARTGANVISLSFDDSQYDSIVNNIAECDRTLGEMKNLISKEPSLEKFSADVDALTEVIDLWAKNVDEIQALNKELETIIAGARANQLALTQQSTGIFDYQLELLRDEAGQDILEASKLRRADRIETGTNISNNLNYIGNSFEVMFKSLDTSRVEEDKKILVDTVAVLEAFLAESTLQYNIDTATSMLKALETYESDINNFIDCLSKRDDLVANGKSTGGNALAAVNDLLGKVETSSMGYADTTIGTANGSLVVVIIFAIVALAVSALLAFYISGIISKPLVLMKDILSGIGSRGRLALTEAEYDRARDIAGGKDETAESMDMLLVTFTRLSEVGKAMEKIADGDLTVELDLLSEEDVMGLSLDKMLDKLNDMFRELKSASYQVSSGSEQVAQGAQELASGSTQQAASIEEFSASLTDLEQKTKQNEENSRSAQEANKKVESLVADSVRSMGEMMEAMQGIDESSRNITRVIKVIDDIAFQTNILALNAAVEAARAGQHGKGFAVVADEVRNLAGKSAAAAKETADLIEGSSRKVNDGNRLVEQTNSHLEAVAETARESVRLVNEVTAASGEQAMSINQMAQGMEQISSVVQSNSATSEQSAAASEQMSAQAAVLNEIVAKFRLRDSVKKTAHAAAAAGEQAMSGGFALSGGTNSVGEKY